MLGRRFALAILFMGFTNIAAAQQNCIAPYAPAVPDGATATEEQMNTVRQEVMAFLADSDSFQSCMLVYLRQMEDEARRGNEPVDQGARANIVSGVNANQRLKERTGEAFNTAVRAHNALNSPEPEGDAAAADDGETGRNAPQ